MAPQRLYRARRVCAKETLSTSKSAAKNKNLTAPPNLSPPQQRRSSITALPESTPFKAVEDNSTPPRALRTRPVTRSQKAEHISEAQDAQERQGGNSKPAIIPTTASGEKIDTSQSRGDQQSDFDPDGHANKQRRRYGPRLRLSAENLEKLQSELGTSSTPIGMGVVSTARGGKGGVKRKKSVAWSDLPQDSTTVTTSSVHVSPAHYRYRVLHDANIFVANTMPPDDIQCQMNPIFNPEISEEKRSSIASIAKRMSNEFLALNAANYREDDCLEVVIAALRALNTENIFAFVRKFDWLPNLKPQPQGISSIRHLGQSHDETDDAIDSPRKRRRRNSSSNTIPEKPQSDAFGSEPFQHSGIKTPRPDCTIGLSNSTIAHALAELGLNKSRMNRFLMDLQDENSLCSDPTNNLTDVRFPILIVEGKAYATGKTPFEAENQAAVAGSCMVNLLQQLTDVHLRCVPDSPGREKALVPLAFSITTCGPLLQFWVHYPFVDNDVTSYYMCALKSCHACIADELENFLVMCEQLMSWNQDEFLTQIVGLLFPLAKRTLVRR